MGHAAAAALLALLAPAALAGCVLPEPYEAHFARHWGATEQLRRDLDQAVREARARPWQGTPAFDGLEARAAHLLPALDARPSPGSWAPSRAALAEAMRHVADLAGCGGCPGHDASNEAAVHALQQAAMRSPRGWRV